MAKTVLGLDEIIGQANIVKWFRNCVERDKLPQVIMLTGPTGIGKTSIAKIVACEIAYMNSKGQLDEAKRAVIEENKSTDCVKLYNMSNLKSQEAVAEVKADLNIGFSSTGRKVIIMDEAHGMSDEAQDSLLTAFESLQLQVYVIVCSTELETFRDAFVGRCILRRLTNLSQADMTKLLRKRISDNQLKFEMPLPILYSLISVYTGREPRRALNLLDSFEPGSLVTTEELQTFINVYEGKQLLALIDCLYHADALRGIEFIQDMEVGGTFVSTLIDLVRISQGGRATVIDKNSVLHLQELVMTDNARRLIGFAINCSTDNRLTRNKVSGYFLRWCKSGGNDQNVPVKMSAGAVHMDDMKHMSGLLEKDVPVVGNDIAEQATTLEQLLASCEVIV